MDGRALDWTSLISLEDFDVYQVMGLLFPSLGVKVAGVRGVRCHGRGHRRAPEGLQTVTHPPHGIVERICTEEGVSEFAELGGVPAECRVEVGDVLPQLT